MQFFMVLMVVKLFANLDHSSGQKRQLSRSTEVLVECSFTRSVRWIVEKKQHLGLQHGEMQNACCHCCPFGAVKTYKGKWGISNNFDGSRLFIDDNFDQMLTFKKKFLAKLATSTESSSHVGSYVICSVEDEFLNNDVFSPIAYLGSIIQQSFLIRCGIMMGVTIASPKLSKSLKLMIRRMEQVMLEMRRCINVRTRIVKEKMFSRCPGVEVCWENCKGTFINSGRGSQRISEYPVEFETLVNLKCAFVIRVTDFNIVNAVENYGISVVTNDVDILDKLNKKWKIDQLDVSDSFAMSQSDFQSVGGESAKDGVSYIGDNSTPVSKDYVANLKQSSADLKRNLSDLYAIEEGLGSSASKPRISVDSICLDEDVANN
ncbi:hypothetical protein HanIR_Chr16g0810791 [Helianthus annuus]|nr:hypothetical protein HanIR_Chr16g0810791 [Helianthus annuus]